MIVVGPLSLTWHFVIHCRANWGFLSTLLGGREDLRRGEHRADGTGRISRQPRELVVYL